jgi:transcriptional regulator with XRE-family HTH domain
MWKMLYSFLAMLNERLQEWLNLSGTTRAELAEKLHVNKRTVDSWLGKVHRPIPQRLRATIAKLIAPVAEPGCLPVTISFTEEEWEAVTSHLPSDCDKKETFKQQMIAMIEALKLPRAD